MSVYVGENIKWPRSKNWPYNSVAHLWADTEEELRTFAKTIGLRESWIQHAGTPKCHFDLTPNVREIAIRHGAKQLDIRAEGHLINESRALMRARLATTLNEATAFETQIKKENA